MTSGPKIRPVACPRCGLPLPPDTLLSRRFEECANPACRAEIRVVAFPALVTPPSETRTVEVGALDESATCFHHPTKRAEVVCDGCGRFLCALCDIELDGAHLCPGCIEAGRKKGTLRRLETARTRYDQVALTLAIVSVPFFVFAPVLSPAALYYVVRHGRSEKGPVTTRSATISAVAAVVFALLGLAAGVMFYLGILQAMQGLVAAASEAAAGE